MWTLLGIGILGLLVVLVAVAVSRTTRPANKMGRKLAAEMGISKNLLMTILEHGQPAYLELLAVLEMQGVQPDIAADKLLPNMQQGILALHQKFGDQRQLVEAWDKIQDRMRARGL